MSPSPLAFPVVADPVASLVVLVYGGYDLALATLRSLRETTRPDVEVVIVDNASPDGAGARLQEVVEGATFVLGDRNLGFGGGMDLGVLHTRAPYVGILNSDLVFEDGWLDPLVTALDEDPALGAATPLYLDEDGAVLDGGRLLGADGWGYGYGDRLAPDDPSLAFQRRVDFGVAASLLVRREAFDLVGGFDPVYGLGYYEDTDLGFSMRAAGYESAYVPGARVRHVHGGSFVPAARARQLERNLPIFLERHGGALRGRPTISRPPYDPHRELVLRDWWAEDRILLLDRRGELADLAVALADGAPHRLVTHAALGGPSPARSRWVEWCRVPDRLERWLEQRRYHYSAVVLADGLAADVDGWMARSQPQAVLGRAGAPRGPHEVEVASREHLDAAEVVRRLGIRSDAARG